MERVCEQITEQARVVPGAGNLPGSVEPDTWYDVFPGPFTPEEFVTGHVYLVVAGELVPVPQRRLKFQRVAPKATDT